MAAVEQLITENLDVWASAVQAKSAAGRGSANKLELYGIKKLRELILDLAVRGLLVGQDPNDEPASELLKKIATEKAQLVKSKQIRKPKALQAIEKDEAPFELPEGWEWVRLGDVTNYGTSDKVDAKDVEPDTWVLELEDVEKVSSRLLAKVRFSERRFRSSKNMFHEGDVIYGKLRPYLDKVLVADEPGVCTTEMIPVRGYACLIPSYLRLAMKSPSFIAYANESTHGMNLPRMGTDKARLALIPLLSESGQHRIVAKVDELMALCDQLDQQQEDSITAHQTLVQTLLDALTTASERDGFTAAWARIADHFDTLFTTEWSIDQLKQTILQLAVMGKLVPQDPDDEPASELLKRIAAEKERLVKDGKIKKQKAIPTIEEDEKPFKLPEGWEWSRLPDIGELARGKSKHRPRNDPTLYSGGNIPLIQTGDVSKAERIIQTYTALYNQTGVAQSRLWPKGTLCITIAANIADTAVLGFEACFPDSVVGFAPFNRNINVRYFDYFIRTAKNHLEEYAPSTAQKNINLEILGNLLVPLPPLHELNRIVAKVDELMDQCDTLRTSFNYIQLTMLQLADAVTEKSIT